MIGKLTLRGALFPMAFLLLSCNYSALKSRVTGDSFPKKYEQLKIEKIKDIDQLDDSRKVVPLTSEEHTRNDVKSAARGAACGAIVGGGLWAAGSAILSTYGKDAVVASVSAVCLSLSTVVSLSAVVGALYGYGAS